MQLTASHCPVCCERYDGNQRRKSRDHIVPQIWGGGDFIAGDVRNTRIMCQDCNSWRASAGHCVAALALMRDVAKARGEQLKYIAHEWDMYGVAREIEPPSEYQTVADLTALRRRASQLARSLRAQQSVKAPEAPVIPNDPEPNLWWQDIVDGVMARIEARSSAASKAYDATSHRESKPYTLKSLRAKGPAVKLPKELVVINGMATMRWNVRETGRSL